VQRPQRCDDQVIPAAVLPLTAGGEFTLASKPNLWPAQRAGRSAAMPEREAINTNAMFEDASRRARAIIDKDSTNSVRPLRPARKTADRATPHDIQTSTNRATAPFDRTTVIAA
jgi:hypothetical protein